MKKHYWLASGVALALSLQAQAITISGQAGKDFTNLEAGLGSNQSGYQSSLNWTHSKDDGNLVGLNLGMNIPLGFITPSIGGKALYLNPAQGKQGFALAVGGGLRLPLLLGISLYGSGYYAPNALTSGVANYREGDLGVQWRPLIPLTVSAGYRYMKMNGKDGYRDNALADGPYIGLSVNF